MTFVLLAVVLALPSAIFAAPIPVPPTAQADWRRDGIDEQVKTALTGQGWRLENDGRVLGPMTKAPVAKAVLEKAVLDLREKKRAALPAHLPPALAVAIPGSESGLNKVKALADADMSRVASYFDGGRTMTSREAAVPPISAGTPGPSVDLPYFTPREQLVGEKILAAAEAAISRDPFGKAVLARLKGKNGMPELPPILIEDQNGPAIAQYDIRRKAIVLDREVVLASVVATVPPRQASALRASLSTRAALLAHLEAHSEAVSAVVKDNDVVIVHELTHAWQDRRDTIFREIARGNLPNVQPLEYEEEAYKTKNMYLHSKLQHDPASVKMDAELSDYIAMMQDPVFWKKELFKGLNASSPSRALPFQSIQDIQAGRVSRTQGRTVVTSDEQQAKALDLRALGRGQTALAALVTTHDSRMSQINAKIDQGGPDSDKALGSYYLVQARTAARSSDRSFLLDQAEQYAKAAEDAVVIEKINKTRERRE